MNDLITNSIVKSKVIVIVSSFDFNSIKIIIVKIKVPTVNKHWWEYVV